MAGKDDTAMLELGREIWDLAHNSGLDLNSITVALCMNLTFLLQSVDYDKREALRDFIDRQAQVCLDAGMVPYEDEKNLAWFPTRTRKIKRKKR